MSSLRMRVFPSTFTSVRLLIDYRPAQLDTQASKEKTKQNKNTVSHNNKDINLQLRRQYLNSAALHTPAAVACCVI